jgi:hypothetical protein
MHVSILVVSTRRLELAGSGNTPGVGVSCIAGTHPLHSSVLKTYIYPADGAPSHTMPCRCDATPFSLCRSENRTFASSSGSPSVLHCR